MKRNPILFALLMIVGIATGLQSCGPAYFSVIPVRPYYVRPPSPYVGAVWYEGSYNYGTRRYNQGSWGRGRPGRQYQEGNWQQGPRGYSYRRGRWH